MASDRIRIIPFFCILLAVALVEVGRELIAHAFPGLSLLLISRLVEIGLILWTVKLWEDGLGALGLKAGTIRRGIFRGLLWSAGFGGAALVAYFLLSAFGGDPLALIRVSLPRDTARLILFFLVGGLVAPVAEELFFRGVVYGFLRRWGVAVALILSTLVFVVVHPLGRAFPLTQAVGGIVFALAYEVEGSLAAPITIHALGNIVIFGLSLGI